MANAIANLKQPDPLTRDLFERDDDERKRAAQDKRERRAARKLSERRTDG